MRKRDIKRAEQILKTPDNSIILIMGGMTKHIARYILRLRDEKIVKKIEKSLVKYDIGFYKGVIIKR